MKVVKSLGIEPHKPWPKDNTGSFLLDVSYTDIIISFNFEDDNMKILKNRSDNFQDIRLDVALKLVSKIIAATILGKSDILRFFKISLENKFMKMVHTFLEENNVEDYREKHGTQKNRKYRLYNTKNKFKKWNFINWFYTFKI